MDKPQIALSDDKISKLELMLELAENLANDKTKSEEFNTDMEVIAKAIDDLWIDHHIRRPHKIERPERKINYPSFGVAIVFLGLIFLTLFNKIAGALLVIIGLSIILAILMRK